MPIVPREDAAKIDFFDVRQPIWAAAASTIGIAAGDAATLLAKVDAAKAARAAALTARANAKSATVTLDDALRDLSAFGAELLLKIKAKAAADGNSVYTAADVPPPATPAPKGPPGQPTDFEATLMVGGDVDLGWTCAQPAGASGTTYQVYRRFTPSAAWEFLGATGERKFIDATIPAGTGFVMYKIRGIRSTAAGPWGECNVTFGAGAGAGGAAVTAVAGPKMAA